MAASSAYALNPIPEKGGVAKLDVPSPTVKNQKHQDTKPVLIAQPKHSLKSDIEQAESLEKRDETSPE